MRYEVLAAVYQACEGKLGCARRVAEFTDHLGIWREELFRALDFLDRRGYIEYHGAGPLVGLAQKGVDYVEKVAGKRRSLREDAGG